MEMLFSTNFCSFRLDFVAYVLHAQYMKINVNERQSGKLFVVRVNQNSYTFDWILISAFDQIVVITLTERNENGTYTCVCVCVSMQCAHVGEDIHLTLTVSFIELMHLCIQSILAAA